MTSQIAAITPINALPLNRSGRLHSPLGSIYTRSDQLQGGVIRPAAFVAPGEIRPLFRIEIDIPLAEAGAEYHLLGTCDGHLPLFSGRATATDAGRQTLPFTVSLAHPTDGFVALGQVPVAWTLSVGEPPQSLGTERIEMEVYFLSNDAGRLFPRGVPLETLRDLSRILGGHGERELHVKEGRISFAEGTGEGAAAKIARIVNERFAFVPPRYTADGSLPIRIAEYPRLANGNPDLDHVTLHLARYRAAHTDPNAVCNCFDVATVLRHYLELANVPGVGLVFIKPFGYLRKTNLIGRGLCNNPFFQSDGNAPLVVDEHDKDRTAFATHVVCVLTDGHVADTWQDTWHIADACAGPHLGTETREEYLRAAIDDQTPDPAQAGENYVPAGDPAHVWPFFGKILVQGEVPPVGPSAAPTAVHRSAFRALTGFRDDAPDPAGGLLVREWPDPRRCPALGGGWMLAYEDLIPGYPEVSQYWRLRRGAETVEVELRVASDGPRTARQRFLDLGSSGQSSVPPLKRGPEGLGDFSAQFRSFARRQYLWVYRTLVAVVAAAQADIDLEAVARWYQQVAAEEEFSPRCRAPLAIDNLDVSASSVRVGEVVSVVIPSALPVVVCPLGTHRGLQLIEEDGPRLAFRAEAAADEELSVVAVDPRTLLSAVGRARIAVG